MNETHTDGPLMDEIHKLDKLMPTPVGVNIICVGYSEKTNVVIIFYLSLSTFYRLCISIVKVVFCSGYMCSVKWVICQTFKMDKSWEPIRR